MEKKIKNDLRPSWSSAIKAMGRFPLITLVFAIISGCSLLQPTKPDPHPSGLTSTASESSPAEPAGAGMPVIPQGPLNLEQAQEIALANNPEIAATQWDLQAADARTEIARAGRWPALGVESGYQRFLDDQRLIAARYNGEPGIFDRDILRGDLVLKLPLYTGGRLPSEIRAAELLSMSEEKRLGRSREELVFNVSGAFYAILSQYEVIRSLEFANRIMEEHLKQVADLLAAQKAARIDLLRTEVRLADLRQRLVKEKSNLAVQNRLLANLLGLDEGADRLAVAGSLAVAHTPDIVLDDLIPAALKQRNDYLAAKARLAAQAARVDAARASHWPTVSLLGSYGARVAGTGGSEDVGALGLGISVPLYDGGRTDAQVNQERAAFAAASERLRKLELLIRLEMETAVLDIRSSAERIEATRNAVEQAKESLRIERLKYDLASGSITDVLDAQSALLQAETNHTRAMADLRIALARLALARGGNPS